MKRLAINATIVIVFAAVLGMGSLAAISSVTKAGQGLQATVASVCTNAVESAGKALGVKVKKQEKMAAKKIDSILTSIAEKTNKSFEKSAKKAEEKVSAQKNDR